MTPRADDELEDLRQDWQQLLAPLTTCPHVGSTGDALIESWAEDTRHYHTPTHLRDVLAGVNQLRTHATDLTSVRLAAWYHDAVYNGRPDDEANSAARAESELAGLRLSPERVAEVGRLIRLTASHHPSAGDRNGETLCDADLKILAAPLDRYLEYTAAVRAEYCELDDAAFDAGRGHVLRSLLEAPALFHTPHGRLHWEARARTNLARELRTLLASR